MSHARSAGDSTDYWAQRQPVPSACARNEKNHAAGRHKDTKAGLHYCGVSTASGSVAASRLKSSGELHGIFKPAAPQRTPAVFLSSPRGQHRTRAGSGNAGVIRSEKNLLCVHTCVCTNFTRFAASVTWPLEPDYLKQSVFATPLVGNTDWENPSNCSTPY